jgi:hypothetical protein
MIGKKREARYFCEKFIKQEIRPSMDNSQHYSHLDTEGHGNMDGRS